MPKLFRPNVLAMLVCGVGLSLSAASTWAQTSKDYEILRNKMVDDEIVAAGVKNERVIKSMRTTLRHEFMPLSQRKFAYFDMGVAIGEGQTISSPFTVAYMTEQLDPQPTDKVLEIGTGSGYQAAVLSPLVQDVYTIEIVAVLGRRAKESLERLKYKNVHPLIGDGYKGWPEHAPFDKIIVTCSPENVPQPLVDQLKEGGRIIVPLGERYQQVLYRFIKKDGKLEREALLPTLFVPMTGAAEDLRKVLPDPLKPTIANGSFEESTKAPGIPDGWYYVRQAEIVSDDKAPAGKKYLHFTNANPGVEARALQAFPVDGRKVKGLDVSLRVKVKGVRPGQTQDQRPALHVTFYDENRAIAGSDWIGPWELDSPDWLDQKRTLTVPSKAREAILRIGLLGATGEASFDALELKASEK